MASRGNTAVAVFVLFLLLSAPPLDAKRVLTTDDTHHSLVSDGGEKAQWGSTCAKLQQRFNTRSAAGSETAVKISGSNGTAGFASVSSTLFSLWSMVRIVRRAHAKECEWSENVDVTSLQAIMTATLQDNPCMSTVEARLAASADDESEKQTDVFLTSMGMLLTGECEEQPMVDVVEGGTVVEPQSIEDADEQVEGLVDELMDVAVAEGEEGDEAAAALLQLQQSDAQPIWNPNSWRNAWRRVGPRVWPPPFWNGVDRWQFHHIHGVDGAATAGTDTVIANAGPQTAQQWVVHGLGVAAWLIGFAIVCTTAVYLFAVILGALLCLLRSILLVLLLSHTSLKTCLSTVVRTSSSVVGTGFVSGACFVGGAGLITTGGVTLR